MNFEAAHRISIYLLLILASLILNLDADVDYAKFYPMAMVVACAAAYFTVDRDPHRAISNGTANLLAAASMFLVYLEIRFDESQLVLACGHWLFYLAIVKLFRPKLPADDWYLILLALMQVLVGCFLSQSDRVGLALLTWAILGLWTLCLFYLHREARHARVKPSLKQDPYPGLFSPPFLVATLRWACLTLLCGFFIFLAMPRSASRGQSPQSTPGARSLTGFSDEVRLGQMGEILENDSVVMSVELFDENGQKIQPTDELLWRGVVLNQYERGRWSRGSSSEHQRQIEPVSTAGLPIIEQRIRLEPINDPTVFVLRPFLDVRPRGNANLFMNLEDGTVIREDGRGRRLRGGSSLDYVVRSLRDPNQTGFHSQDGEVRYSLRLRSTDPLLEVPPEDLPRYREIAEAQLRDIPESDLLARAKALEAYLRDSNSFRYDLSMTRIDTSIDPILDFLQNRRRGHCEYFASALAMLLRSVGIPCRVVNGFKGGDWNEIAWVLTVRQKHAHSWVEACLDSGGRPSARSPIWLTLDPTPGAQREEEVARVSRMPGSIRQFSDLVRYVWVFYIAGFNADRQQQLLYRPLRNLSEEARNGFLLMGSALLRAFRWLTDFPSFSSFFSIKGFLLSIVTMLLLTGLVRLFTLLWRLTLGRFRSSSNRFDDPSGALAAYGRLIRALASCGLERPRGETPREFARRASLYLADRTEAGLPLAQVPSLVVDAFYRVRYGGLELPSDQVTHLEHLVDSLESGLSTSSA